MSATVAAFPEAVEAVRRTARMRRQRARWVHGVLAVLVVLLAGASLTLGDYRVPVPDLAATLLGRGEGLAPFVVLELRLPRLTLAVLSAVAFALSGALFQSVLRNPLASPDIIGVSGGASVGAVFAILVLGLSGAMVSLAAFCGASVVALVVYLLSWKDGLTGQRFVLTGIGVAFVATAVLGYLLTRSDVRDAQAALVWMVGSLSGAGWEAITRMALALTVLVPATAALAGRLRALQLGDETATALGVRVEWARAGLLVTAVALAAVATAAVGPVAFVAFTAAPIARRLVDDGGLALVAAVLVGISIVLGSDLVAQHLLPNRIEVPVGIVTGAIGGPYLLWLLATANRPGKGV